LVGHPLRWRLLCELARSDRLVHELTGVLGESQNLVSYHLGKLRGAQLVSARRSSADGRDSYYTVNLTRVGAVLAAAGKALHPGLRLGSPSESRRPQDGTLMARVLFLCTGNSARSQMAEALTRTRSGGTVDAYSAGSHPKPLHQNAIQVMRNYDIDLRGRRSKHLREFAEQRFDYVISLCDRVREVRPKFPGPPHAVHWSIPDPAAAGGSDEASYPAFERTAVELDTRIGFLLAALCDPITTTTALEK
jgi:protein-tyrosine-phosphatase/DNA-binding transcriptional ArsR family regulator